MVDDVPINSEAHFSNSILSVVDDVPISNEAYFFQSYSFSGRRRVYQQRGACGILSVVDGVPINGEALVETSSISRICQLTLGGAYRIKVACVYL